jgi:small-conductance mechanosensitive channel
MIKKALSLVLSLLAAGPVQAAQSIRVYRAPAPIRSTGIQTGPMNLKLNSPLTAVSGLPLLTPNLTAKPGVTLMSPAETVVPQAYKAETGEVLSGDVVAPMAQLDAAGKVAEFSRADEGGSSENSRTSWTGYWDRSGKKEGSSIVKGRESSKTQVLPKSTGKQGKTALYAGGLLGVAEFARQAVQQLDPVLSVVGSITAWSWLTKPVHNALDGIGKRHGWDEKSVANAKRLYSGLLLVGGALFALGAPAAAPAVWAIAGPLFSGVGVLSLTKLADGAIAKRIGEGSAKGMPLGLRTGLWLAGGALAITAASSGLGLGLEVIRQGLSAVSPLLSPLGAGLFIATLHKPVAKLVSSLAQKRGWSPRATTAAQTAGLAGAALLLSAVLILAPGVWAVAAPYAAGFTVVTLTRKLDGILSRFIAEKPSSVGLRAVLWALGGAIAVEAAGFPVDMLLTGLWGMVLPYMGTAGTLVGTWAASKAVRWGIDRLATKAGWQPNTKVVVRLIANIVVWTGGAAFGLSAAGVSTKALMTTFGIGGIAVTMAAKDFIGNFMEAMKILLLKPYVVGDRIRVADEDYTLKGMSLRYLELEREPGKITLMTYAQIADKTITLKRPYAAKHRKFFAGGLKPVTLADIWRSVTLSRVAPKIHMGKSALLAGLGLAVIFGMPLVAASAVTTLPWLTAALPYVKAAGALWATRWASAWLTGLVTKLTTLVGWDPQSAAVVKFLAQAAAWTLGGTAALYMAGVNWAALLTAMGASSIALGWASADLIGNLIQGMWILATQPFKIGDSVEIGKIKGRIVDMGVHYIVLESEAKEGEQAGAEHTLVPYGVVKASAFTVAAPKEDVK